MHWPLHVAMLQGLGRVVDPTAADDVPCAQAPSEREDEEENLGRNPPPNAATCTLDTSPTDNGNEASWAPPALAFAGHWNVMATLQPPLISVAIWIQCMSAPAAISRVSVFSSGGCVATCTCTCLLFATMTSTIRLIKGLHVRSRVSPLIL